MEPRYFNLKPGEEIAVTLTAERNNPEVVSEVYYLHAVIEKIEKKQIIIETLITAEFVRPLLKFNKRAFYFRADYGVEKITAYTKGNTF